MGSQETHHRDAALAPIAGRQFGAFTREQAFEVGFTAAAIKKRLSRSLWVMTDHNVYRFSATPETWHQRLIAACLAGPAVASHRSAGHLWDFPGMSPELVEVTALRHRRRKPTAVRWHESFHLSDRDVTAIDGIPCTRPVRTFLDLGVVLSSDELESVLNEGIRRNLLSVAAISQRLEAFGLRRPGTRVVQAVLKRNVPNQRAPESVLETRFLQLIRSACLPEPVPQYEVTLTDGSKVRLDFAYPHRLVGIELDGAAYHSGWRAEKRDRRRDTQLGAIGWRVLRFGWDEVTRDPEYVLAMMRPVGSK
jgi:very-short-patch-repair endonuclease